MWSSSMSTWGTRADSIWPGVSAAAVGRRTPVVLISAYLEEDLEDLIVESEAIGFVSKSSLTGSAIVELVDRDNRNDQTRPA